VRSLDKVWNQFYPSLIILYEKMEILLGDPEYDYDYDANLNDLDEPANLDSS
jgi:hypothetical protein